MSILKYWNGSAWVEAVVGAQGEPGVPGTQPVFSMSGSLSVLAGGSRYYVESPASIAKIRASVGTQPTGTAVVVDVLLNGSSVLAGSLLAISPGSNTTVNTTSVPVVAGDYLTVDVTQVGSITPGADLSVSITFN